MEGKSVLFQRGSWRLEKRSEAPSDLIELLASTIWGTPGKTLYQHLDTRKRISQLQNTHYIWLHQQGRTSAGLALCQRTTRDSTERSNAFYVRYFSFAESLRIKIAGKDQSLSEPNFAIRPNSFLKNRIRDIFNGPDSIAAPMPDTARTFFYAYVESENRRSLQICEALGFQRIRSFCTLPFSRFTLRKSSEVFLAQANEQEEITAAVEKQYQGYNLFFTDHLFLDNQYYVLKKEGKIVAGIRAMPVNWVIEDLEGISGTIILSVLPHLPWISRLFNPRNFRFVAFDSLFFLPGYEQEVINLMEGVLGKLEIHAGMIWLDNETELFHFLLHSGKLGLLHRLNSRIPVDVLLRPVDFQPGALDRYRQSPVYISALDLS